MNWLMFKFGFRLLDVFGAGDRAAGALPPELEGKSPLEIAQYYQQQMRDQQLRQQHGAPPPPPPITQTEFEADPLGSTRQMINQVSVSREEFNQLTSAAQNNLMQTAKLLAKEGKEHWLRFLPQMEQIAQQTTDKTQLVNPGWWETTYNYLVGQNYSTLTAEAATAAAARQSSESGGGPPAPVPVPRELSSVELQVAAGLGMTADAWRAADAKRIDGRLPVTLDNRQQARSAA